MAIYEIQRKIRSIEDLIKNKTEIYNEYANRYEDGDMMALVEAEKTKQEISFLENERMKLVKQLENELDNYRDTFPKLRESFVKAVEKQSKTLKALESELGRLEKTIEILQEYEKITGEAREWARQYYETAQLLGIDAENILYRSDDLRDLRLELLFLLKEFRKRILHLA